jgi:hypothetical protein
MFLAVSVEHQAEPAMVGGSRRRSSRSSLLLPLQPLALPEVWSSLSSRPLLSPATSRLAHRHPQFPSPRSHQVPLSRLSLNPQQDTTRGSTSTGHSPVLHHHSHPAQGTATLADVSSAFPLPFPFLTPSLLSNHLDTVAQGRRRQSSQRQTVHRVAHSKQDEAEPTRFSLFLVEISDSPGRSLSFSESCSPGFLCFPRMSVSELSMPCSHRHAFFRNPNSTNLFGG